MNKDLINNLSVPWEISVSDNNVEIFFPKKFAKNIHISSRVLIYAILECLYGAPL